MTWFERDDHYKVEFVLSFVQISLIRVNEDLAMRLGISGSFSTGKTRLCEAVAEELIRRGVPITIVAETAREVISEGFPLDSGVTLDSVLRCATIQLQKTLTFSSSLNIIADRTFLDLYAFLKLEECAEIPDQLKFLVGQLMIVESERIDLRVYLPVEFEIVSDGIRANSTEYQHRFDAKIREQLDVAGAAYLEVSGTLEERKNKVASLFG